MAAMSNTTDRDSPPGDTRSATKSAPGEPDAIGGPYARYTLGILVVVYVFNFLDRQILSILNEEIKADLGLTDSQMGFLYGTAFAVFYAIFGIPLGRLADVWVRRSLISLGLAFWSLMTAVSGLSRNFLQLGAARIGVGVGEASATPAAFSMLSDSFPPAVRASVLALYSSGIYIGAGLGLGIGGLIVDRWELAYQGVEPPFGLRGWQVAFLAVGLPGLLLAVWVRTLREPRRGQADGILAPDHPHPFREFGRELAAVLPPLTLANLVSVGAGRAGVMRNLLMAAALAVAAALLIRLTGDVAQWSALAVGLYGAISWVQSVSFRDRPTATLVFRTASLRLTVVGCALLAFTGYGVGYWTPPFFLRHHEVSLSQLGTVLGGLSALGGWLGVTFGGVMADRWRQQVPHGRLWVAWLCAVLPLPFGAWMFLAPSLPQAYVAAFLLNVATASWIGVGASTVQDLVLPRMRALASAFYLLVITFIGLALGPYTIGKLSDAFGDLRWAMSAGIVSNGLALLCLVLASRRLADDEASLLDRAREAGEPDL